MTRLVSTIQTLSKKYNATRNNRDSAVDHLIHDDYEPCQLYNSGETVSLEGVRTRTLSGVVLSVFGQSHRTGKSSSKSFSQDAEVNLL